MKEYLDVLQKILDEGIEKESGRPNMPNTIGISKADISMDLSKGFPLLTTKKMYWKGIVIELLWFLRGETNIKYLVDNNVNIWNSDAYRWYLKHIEEYTDNIEPLSMEEFIKTIKDCEVERLDEWFMESDYALGDLGKVYGHQWRNQNGVDQIKDVVEGLKNNPYSRYHIIDGWNKADFPEMALPPCHLLYQFIVRPLSIKEREDIYYKQVGDYPYGSEENQIAQLNDNLVDVPKFYLDLNMYQRSCDTFLGVPFNIASYALFTMMIAQVTGLKPGEFIHILGDTHIYSNHFDQVKEQLSRTPRKLPSMKINPAVKNIEDFVYEDFELIDYNPYPSIKAPISV